VAVADLNGDGYPDIVVANGTNPSTVSILFNNPANPGTFSAPTTLATRDGYTASVQVASLLGDGVNDIITTNQSANPAGTASVFLQDRNNPGSFLPAVTYGTGPTTRQGTNDPYGLAVADYYGDGYPAVAVSDALTGDVTILRNPNGTGALSPYTIVASITKVAGGAATVTGLAAGDLGTGSPSLVTGNDVTADGISVVVNNAGTFAAPVRYAAGTNPFSVTVADVNGDGYGDVLAANIGTMTDAGSVSLFLNTGTGAGTLMAAQNITAGTNPSSVAVADVQPDGLADLLVTNLNSNNVTVLVQGPTPPRASQAESSTVVASGAGAQQAQQGHATAKAGRTADPVGDLAVFEQALRKQSAQTTDFGAQLVASLRHTAGADGAFSDPLLSDSLRGEFV
jgi:hypothetical protein